MRPSLSKQRRERRRQTPTAPRQASPPPAASASAVARMRDAGGPLDHAFYSCACGYVFVAQVSTTVTCPHCQAGQAW